MKLARQIMTKDVITAVPEDSIAKGYQVMRTSDIRHLLIVNDDKLLGVVSEGDVMVKAELDNGFLKLPKISLGSIMSTKLITCTPFTEISWVAGLMVTHVIKCVPVLHSNKLVGVITITDLLDQFCLEEELCGQNVMPLSFAPRRTPPISRL